MLISLDFAPDLLDDTLGKRLLHDLLVAHLVGGFLFH